MLKKILIALIVLVVIFIAGVFLLLSRAETIFASYQPQVEAELTKHLETPVRLGEVGISLFPTTQISVRGFEIGEQTESKNVELGAFNFQTSLLSLISGKLVIDTLCVSDPKITVVKDANGIFIEGLPRKLFQPKKEQRARLKDSAPKSASSPEQPKNISAPVEVELNNLCLENGQIHYRDETSQSEYHLQNIEVQSAIDLKEDAVLLPELTASLTEKKLGAVAIQVRSLRYGLKDQQVELPTAKVSALQSELELSAKYNLGSKQGEFKVLPSKLALQGINVQLDANGTLSADQANLKEANFKLLEGAGKAQASVGMVAPQSVDAKLRVEKLQLEPVASIALKDKPVKFAGLLDQFSLNVGGSLQPAPITSLNGAGELLVTNAQLNGLSLAGEILQSVDNLPFLKGSLLGQLSPTERENISKGITTISRMGGKFSLSQGILNTPDFVVVTDLVQIEPRGNINLAEKKLDLGSTARFSVALSSKLVAKVKELKSLLDDQQRLSIPVRFVGTFEKPLIVPDTEELMKLAAGQVIRDKASELLGKALGNKSGDSEKKGKSGIGDLLGF